jgi:phospho-2-dehydro-3-deoxyheptonate aldolase
MHSISGDMERGKSITDACLGWQDAEKMLRDLANI